VIRAVAGEIDRTRVKTAAPYRGTDGSNPVPSTGVLGFQLIVDARNVGMPRWAACLENLAGTLGTFVTLAAIQLAIRRLART
jgi:hypothetical protein